MIPPVFIRWYVVITLALGLLTAQGRRPFDRGGPPFGPQGRVDHLANRLSLTDAQKQQALDIFTAADKTSEPVKDSLDQARQTLRESARRNAPSAQIDQLAATVGNLTGQLLAIETKAMAQFYTLLTAEQRQKMDQPFERRGMPPPMPDFGPPKRH